MHTTIRFAALAALFLASGVSGVPTTTINLPVVDLGYDLHQALTYNETSQVYKFQNIRYAQPPVGNLRFRAPISPKKNRTAIQTGSEMRTCPQGVPSWQGAVSVAMLKFYNPEVPFNLSIWEETMRNARPPNVNFNLNSSEDCLFLDIHVPKKVLDSAQSTKSHSSKSKKGAPVLVWIHGGGYVLGSKSGSPGPSFNPRGLMWHAGLGNKDENSDDMIFVGINYRLGATGFLASPEVARDGNLNAGILDQRFALEWVQSNIHLFGGDKKRVTVMGESAGGGSILIHMSAYGGRKGAAPFAAAIPQSPAFMPTASQSTDASSNFLALLNVTTLCEARKLPTEAIILANERQIFESPSTNYVFGPVIDGSYIPEAPASLLKSGKFDTSVTTFAGHNSFEGGIFPDSNVTTDAQFRPWIERSLLGMSRKEIDHLIHALYPAIYDGSLGYTDVESRQMAMYGEALIDCNYNLIGNALHAKGKKSYAYQFAVHPGFHIEDTKYTFNDPTSPPFFPKTQDLMQEMIVGFVQTGTPKLENGKKADTWGAPAPNKRGKGVTGPGRNIIRIDEGGLSAATSMVNATRCAWWSEFQLQRKH